MDIADIRVCILYGSPLTALDAIQKIGRAGRDGQPSTAIIFPFTTPFFKLKKGTFRLNKNKCFKLQMMTNMYGCKNFTIKHFIHSPVCKCIPCQCSLCNCCTYCKSTCPCKVEVLNV